MKISQTGGEARGEGTSTPALCLLAMCITIAHIQSNAFGTPRLFGYVLSVAVATVPLIGLVIVACVTGLVFPRISHGLYLIPTPVAGLLWDRLILEQVR